MGTPAWGWGQDSQSEPGIPEFLGLNGVPKGDIFRRIWGHRDPKILTPLPRMSWRWWHWVSHRGGLW